MVADLNKGITHIDYNYLNLPERVELSSGTVIHYGYDATGVKHSKIVDDGSPDTTQYSGPFHYYNSTLQFLQHAEGRALKSGSQWTYEYHLTDHLGNVRVTVDESGNVVQRDDYYPFGMAFNSYTQGTKNNYLYNQGLGSKTFQGEEGKTFEVERQPELGIDLTEFRVYDPALGRFLNVDPLADSLLSWSP